MPARGAIEFGRLGNLVLDESGTPKDDVRYSGVGPEPDVIESLLRGEALAGIDLEEAREEVFGVVGEVSGPAGIPKMKFAIQDRGGGLGYVVVEGQTTAEEDVGDDAEGPEVDGSRVGLTTEHFGSEVAACSEEAGRGELRLDENFGEAEIDNLDVVR